MCDGHLPPFTMRFGDFKRVRHQKKGVPEPPNILLVVDFSNYVSADEFCDHDFDEDLMLDPTDVFTLPRKFTPFYCRRFETSCPTMALEPSWSGTCHESICLGPGHECFFRSSLAWPQNDFALL